MKRIKRVGFLIPAVFFLVLIIETGSFGQDSNDNFE